jgi:cytochrome c2
MNRLQTSILFGIIFALVTSAIIVFYGLGETERMAAYQASASARAIEGGAEIFQDYCARCHGTQGEGIIGICPPLNDRYFFDNRLKEVGWSGTQTEYIIATVSSGRLVSTRPQLYPGAAAPGQPAMPSFVETFGGPLRLDQVNDVAAFIMNWQSTAEQISAVPTPSGPLAGSDINKELPEGDPAAGEAMTVSLGCTACHIAGTAGPPWPPTADVPGIGERALERYTQSDYTGAAATPEQYLFESIVAPNAYLVPPFASGLMPTTYSALLTEQDMADIIAYLLTVR